MDENTPITNHDLLERIKTLEIKVDLILASLDKATGAWLFVKLMGAISVGLAVIVSAFTGWFHK